MATKKVQEVVPPTPVLSEPTITAGDKTYSIASLPDDVQKLIGIYQSWEVELQAARTEVFKLEAAIRGLSIELEGRFKQLSEAQ